MAARASASGSGGHNVEGNPSIFRKEALEYYQDHRRQEGDLLRITPRWTGWAYRSLIAMLVISILFCLLGTVSEYASGPALVRVEQRLKGPILEHGQPQDEVSVYLQVFFPGHYRPFLETGMPLRVELEGFRYDYLTVYIESIGDQLIGPAEVRRHIGPALEDAVRVEGAQVLVRARMPSRTFISNGRTFSYFDGMSARAEVALRSEYILVTLLPGLKVLFSHGG